LTRLFFLAAAVVALAACQTGPAARRYDPDRLPNDRLAAMVERPIAQIEHGDLSGGLATFEAMAAAARTRGGAHSLREADLLTAFGSQLHNQTVSSGDPGYSERALSYLQRATEAYRALFGPDHPEVATALNSWADVERYLRPHAPAAAEAALEEAWRIRRAALGPSHKETLWTGIYLASTRSRLAWTRGEPARIERISADLIEIVALSRASDAATAREMPVVAQLRRVDLYARHRRWASALAAFAAARADAVRAGDDEACALVQNGGPGLETELAGAGLASKLADLHRAIEADIVRCAALAGAD